MPFHQGPLGDADRGARVGIGVAEVQPDGVGGEDFGAHGDFAETEPGQDDAGGGDEEEIEGWVPSDGVGKGRGSTGGVGAEDAQDPEEDEDGPACEAVGPFENVVPLCAECWVCGGEDGDEDGKDHVYDQNNREISLS